MRMEKLRVDTKKCTGKQNRRGKRGRPKVRWKDEVMKDN